MDTKDIKNLDVGDWIGGFRIGDDPRNTTYEVLYIEKNGDYPHVFFAREGGISAKAYNPAYYSKEIQNFLKTCTVKINSILLVEGAWHIAKKGNKSNTVNQSKDKTSSQYEKDVKFFFGDPTEHKRGNSGLEFL